MPPLLNKGLSIGNEDIPYESLNGNSCNHSVINEGSDDQLEIFGYRNNCFKIFLFWLGILLTVGFLKLFVKWFPHWEIKLTCSTCSLKCAKWLVVKDVHGHVTIAEVITIPLNSLPTEFTTGSLRSFHGSDSECYGALNAVNNTVIYFRFFVHNYIKYVWDSRRTTFRQLKGFDEATFCSDFFEKFQGYSIQEQKERCEIYGPNVIDIKVKSYWKLLVEEVLNPFYVFQVASITLWMLDTYYYYATCICIISVISIAISLYETKKQQNVLRNMVSSSNSVTMKVYRKSGLIEDIPSAELVPGDIIVIPPNGCLMACDAVLTAGNCIVNESMLTGESVPEIKTALTKQDDREVYSPDVHKRHTLFCGTQVIQTRYYGNNDVMAVVVRTGFSTSKGELVRSILFPKPLGFKFYRDSMHFVLLLFCFSAIGMAYSIYSYIERHVEVRETIIRALDIITIVVPPALPAAMTVGTIYAQNRLKKKNVFCISPPRINIGGKLKLICFDKTGTLTEGGLDFWGLLPTDGEKFTSVMHNPTSLPPTSPLLATMATCHSLTRIDGELNGDPLDLKMFLATEWELDEPGADTTRYDMLAPTVVRPRKKKCVAPCNIVDLYNKAGIQEIKGEMHLSSSTIEDDLEFPFEVGIVRQFPFSSNLQRMSVICRTLGNRCMEVYVKGAPEKIVTLCLPETVPDNFSEILHGYAVQGFRLIAFAYRSLSRKVTWHHAQRIKRQDVECDLKFLGLLIMRNALKPETSRAIQVLLNANIRPVMVTGDNILTALSVARDCGMIHAMDQVLLVKATPPDSSEPAKLYWEHPEMPSLPPTWENSASFRNVQLAPLEMSSFIQVDKRMHFATDGKSFSVIRTYFPYLFSRIIVRGTVFARMTPEQKAQLVESLQKLGYVVGMCGDGANDCGALKAADVGISLSEAEASVAAPFTSKVPNIECVPIVIKEGRCALVTSFSIFKFIASYSLIQFISVLILYSQNTNLTDAGFLYVDLAIITTLAVVMGYTEAGEKLVARRPVGSLVNVPTIISLLLQIILVIIVQLACLTYMWTQPWYKPLPPNTHGTISSCWENTVVFLSSCYQYFIVALIYSKGPPYRKPFYTNIPFLGSLLILSLFTTFLLFNPFAAVANFFQLVKWQPNRHFRFRLTIFLLACINFLLSVVIEMGIVESYWLKHMLRWKKRRLGPKNKYKVIEKELKEDPSWPPVNESVFSDVSETSHSCNL